MNLAQDVRTQMHNSTWLTQQNKVYYKQLSVHGKAVKPGKGIERQKARSKKKQGSKYKKAMTVAVKECWNVIYEHQRTGNETRHKGEYMRD